MPNKKESDTTVSSLPSDESNPTISSTIASTEYSKGNKPLSSAPVQIPISYPEDGMLTVEWIQDLTLTFDWSSRNLPPSEFPSVFPVDVFDTLVLTASKILHKEPNCVVIDDFDQDSRVVVVGDVHGQLHDVLFLLRDAGFPSKNCFFVFNGDYVDRGAWGLETFLLLLAWKVFLPHRVYLLRGNHESKYCTSVYGFEKEVMAKYGDKGKHAYRKCLGCFEGLPLASLIAKARRSVLDPPWNPQLSSNLIPGDLLWSDPSMKLGLSENTERGIGLLWGPDSTEEFLKKFSLKLIIRSHEGPDARQKRPDLAGMDNGYTIDHDVESGMCITLFSAPDYPQFQATEERFRNKGAYIVLKPPKFDIPDFNVFEAVTPRPDVNPFYDFKNAIDSDEELELASMGPST
ncbi:serine/threonine-protein phosphatase 7 [Citrus sinensis]|nr:serine/threonine-protein phosphatase 7 [Citrus sinensis]